MRATRWGVAVALVSACAQGGGGNPEQETAAARKAIESLNAEFVTHFNQGHGDIAAAQYVDDARLMIVSSPVAKGKAEIAAAVTGLAAVKATLTIATDQVTVSGPLAVERGTWSLTVTPPGAAGPATESGTFLVQWQKVGDKWLRVNDMGTSDKPFPPEPAPGPPPAAAPPAKKK